MASLAAAEIATLKITGIWFLTRVCELVALQSCRMGATKVTAADITCERLLARVLGFMVQQGLRIGGTIITPVDITGKALLTSVGPKVHVEMTTLRECLATALPLTGEPVG